jgi:hypothetical protein
MCVSKIIEIVSEKLKLAARVVLKYIPNLVSHKNYAVALMK